MTAETDIFVCPECKRSNVYELTPNDGDSSKMDIGVVRCWYCKSNVVFFDGEHADEYRPHIEGESKWDEYDRGDSADGFPTLIDR